MLRRLKIGQRIGSGVAVLVGLLLAVVATAYSGFSAYGDLLEGDIKLSQLAERAQDNVLGLRRYEKDMFLNITDKAREAEYERHWKEEREHLLERLKEME